MRDTYGGNSRIEAAVQSVNPKWGNGYNSKHLRQQTIQFKTPFDQVQKSRPKDGHVHVHVVHRRPRDLRSLMEMSLE